MRDGQAAAAAAVAERAYWAGVACFLTSPTFTTTHPLAHHPPTHLPSHQPTPAGRYFTSAPGEVVGWLVDAGIIASVLPCLITAYMDQVSQAAAGGRRRRAWLGGEGRGQGRR